MNLSEIEYPHLNLVKREFVDRPQGASESESRKILELAREFDISYEDGMLKSSLKRPREDRYDQQSAIAYEVILNQLLGI